MRKRFIKKKKQSEDVALQITSMADVFTILLVFLLKSSATEPSKITPKDNIVLPEVHRIEPLTETLKLELSQNLLLLDDKPVAELTDFAFDPSDLEVNGTSRSLNTQLIQLRRKNTLEKTPRMMILADQNTPFSTLKKVLNSASITGYEDFKLVVVEDQ